MRDVAARGSVRGLALASAAAFALGVTFATGVAAHGGSHPRPDPRAVSAPSLPTLLRSTLIDQAGEPFTIASLAGRPLLVSLMYTACTTYCTTQTADLRRLQRRLSDSNPSTAPAMLSISLTPEADTPETLRAYAARFGVDHRSWQFATGEPDVVASLAAALSAGVERRGDGLPDHRMIVHLLDAELQPVQRYRADPIDVDHLAREIDALHRVERARRRAP